MMFFYVSMGFCVRRTPKHAKFGIFTLLYTFYIMQSIYLKKSKRSQCLWLKNDKTRLITPFVRFIEGVEWFNFEIVSKTPNMVFFCFYGFYCMNDSQTRKIRHIYNFIHFLYIAINIPYKKRKRSQFLLLKKL